MENKTFTQKREQLLIVVLWDIFNDDTLNGITKAKELGFFAVAEEMKANLETDAANDQAKDDAYNDGIRAGAVLNGMTGKEMVDDLFECLNEIFKPMHKERVNDDVHQERGRYGC